MSRHESAPVQTPPEEIVTCSILNRRADRDRLVAAIDLLGERLLRLKGVVDLGEGPRLVESVFGVFTEQQLGKERVRYGTTALGWKIPKAELLQAFEAAFLPDAESLIQIELK